MVEMWSTDIPVADITWYLSPEERQQFLGLGGKRRQLWLKGRCAAKRVIQRAIKERTKQNIASAKIEIIGRPGQRPLFRLLDEVVGFDPAVFCLAISHVGDRAVATLAVIERDGCVGIDIERPRSFSEQFARAFLTDREYEQSLRAGQTYMLQCWCYKEAYLKAIGTGLRVHPRRIETIIGNRGQLIGLKQDGRSVAIVARALRLSGIAFGAIVYAPLYTYERQAHSV